MAIFLSAHMGKGSTVTKNRNLTAILQIKQPKIDLKGLEL